MKIVITSQLGRIGKSSIAGNVFLPFMPEGTKFFSIESVNDGAEQFGVDLVSMRGGEIIEILTSVMTEEHALLDVGASNFEEFFLGLGEFGGVSEFDRFVIPTVPGEREGKETMKTIATLQSFGVPAEAIHVIFNRVLMRNLTDVGETMVKEQFSDLLDLAKRQKNCVANPRSYLRETSFFDHLTKTKQSLVAALSDETDYTSALKAAAKDPVEHLRLRNAWAAMRLAKTEAADFQRVYSLVTDDVVEVA